MICNHCQSDEKEYKCIQKYQFYCVEEGNCDWRNEEMKMQFKLCPQCDGKISGRWVYRRKLRKEC